MHQSLSIQIGARLTPLSLLIDFLTRILFASGLLSLDPKDQGLRN